MARRRDEPSSVEMMFEIFQTVPWFVGPICAAVVYVALGWLAPWWWPMVKDGDTLNNKKPADFIAAPFGLMAKAFAPYAGGLVLLIWGAAEISKLANRRRLDGVQDRGDIRDLDWREFEKLLCEAFRRQGYAVEHSGRESGDGGVDIRLRKDNQLSLVQCKHWKSWQVGVATVRELLGVVTSERAQWGIIVTSGTFSGDAVQFAGKNHIELIDGDKLARLIQSVQPSKSNVEPVATTGPAVNDKSCPQCGSPMVPRTAKRGSKAGSQFYGCSKYPACNGTRSA